MRRKPKPSQKKLDACRANGAKGAGKKSAESRHKCALNALKHGLCSTAAEAMVLPNEDPELFRQLEESYLRRYRPQDECEHQVVLQIINAMWRMRRVPSMETALFHAEIVKINQKPEETGYTNFPESFKNGIAFRNMAINDRAFENLGRYESRILRTFSRLTQDLDKLQSNRPDYDDDFTPTTPTPSTPDSKTEQCKNEATADAAPPVTAHSRPAVTVAAHAMQTPVLSPSRPAVSKAGDLSHCPLIPNTLQSTQR